MKKINDDAKFYWGTMFYVVACLVLPQIFAACSSGDYISNWGRWIATLMPIGALGWVYGLGGFPGVLFYVCGQAWIVYSALQFDGFSSDAWLLMYPLTTVMCMGGSGLAGMLAQGIWALSRDSRKTKKNTV